jgi:ribosomal protein S11
LKEKAPYKGRGRIRADRKPQGIRYRETNRKPPSMAALYAASDAGAVTDQEAMTALFLKISGGGRGGSAALRAFLDALE